MVCRSGTIDVTVDKYKKTRCYRDSRTPKRTEYSKNSKPEGLNGINKIT